VRSVDILIVEAPLRNPRRRRGFPFAAIATPVFIPLQGPRRDPNPLEEDEPLNRRKRFTDGLHPSPDPRWFPFDRKNPRGLDEDTPFISRRHHGGFLATLVPPAPDFTWYAFFSPKRDNNPLGNEDNDPVRRRGFNPSVFFTPVVSHALPFLRRPQQDFPDPYEPVEPGRHYGTTSGPSGGRVPPSPIIIPEPPPAPGGNVEVYVNLAETLVGPGGYSVGSGILNVVGVAAFPANGNFRVVLSDPTSGNPRVILQVTGINSATQFAVVPEGADAIGFVSDKVTAVLTSGALDAIRANISRIGRFSELPTAALSKPGDRFDAEDGFSLRYDGTTWTPFATSVIMRKPRLADYGSVNLASSSVADGGAGIYLRNAASETGLNVYSLAAPSAPYVLVVRMAGYLQFASGHAPGFGVCFRNSTSGKIETLQVGNASGGLEIGVDYWTSPTVFSSALAAAVPFMFVGEQMWLAIADDGTNKEFAFSPDGVNFETVFSESRTANFTADRLGFFIHTDGAAQVVAAVLKSWRFA
jgi:hypothetical protein